MSCRLPNVGLVLASLVWFANLWLALDTTFTMSPVYGIPDLVVAVGGCVALKIFWTSWSLALLGSAFLGFLVMFLLFVATFSVY